ncbi:MAG: FAD-dependent oxidoreductase, partial [Bacteroidia bacterium]
MQSSYYANIVWQDGMPINCTYQDRYFSSISATGESEYVFLRHNDLAKRFAGLQNGDTFVIAEIGFGAGINFLMTLNLWRRTVTSTARLFYLSFEKYPIHPSDLKKILANFPELADVSSEFLTQYYLLLPTTHRMHFVNQVYLNLIIGDAVTTIKSHDFYADAWFLDGFDPQKNCELWSEEVIKAIAKRSYHDMAIQKWTTFATYSASSLVRKLLTTNVFVVKRDKGFHKREMLYGHKEDTISSPNKIVSSGLVSKDLAKTRIGEGRITRWFDRCYNHNPTKKVLVIGGGISGASTSYALSKRGYQVTLYEKNSTLAQEASGNYQGILYGSFFGSHNPMLELSLAGMKYSHYLINCLLENNINLTSQNLTCQYFANCGLVMLAHNKRQEKQHDNFLKNSNLPEDFLVKVSKAEIAKLAGIPVNVASGLYLESGLWLCPQMLVQKLAKRHGVIIKLNSNFLFLRYLAL